MTLPDLIAEWNCEYQTRIGCLCGIADPTPEQKQIASDEADAHVAALKRLDAMKKLTLEEVKSIVLAEKSHWEKFNSDRSIGAIGACANIYAALCGIRAPWHPAPKPLSLAPKRKQQ